MRVFLVSASRLVSDAVASVLEAGDEVTLVGVATDAQTAVEHLRAEPVDLALVDANPRKGDALRLTEQLRDRFPKVEILPFGLHRCPEVVEFAEAGASGYLLEEASLSELVGTIRSIARRQTPCSPRVAARLFARIGELSRHWAPHPPQENPLTRREREILNQIAAGLSNKEIAQRLHVAPSTVKNHVHKVLEKLHVHRRRDAVIRAFKLGLIRDPLNLRPRRQRG